MIQTRSIIKKHLQKIEDRKLDFEKDCEVNSNTVVDQVELAPTIEKIKEYFNNTAPRAIVKIEEVEFEEFEEESVIICERIESETSDWALSGPTWDFEWDLFNKSLDIEVVHMQTD